MTHVDHCSTDVHLRRGIQIMIDRHADEIDSQLLVDARAGNEQAFTELCTRNGPYVRRKIFTIVRNQEDADDVLQETLISAYTHFETFRGASRFSTWITQIGINQALMLLRRRKRQPIRLAELEVRNTKATDWRDLSDPSPDPEQACMKHQEVLLLRRAVQHQRADIRVVIDAYYQGELSLHETADVLGISVAAAKSRLIRGRRKLRRVMESYRSAMGR